MSGERAGMELLGEYGRAVNAALAHVDQYTAATAKGKFTVTRDNVLAAAKIIKTQARALQDRFDAVHRELVVSAPGDDDVSTRIAPAWNDLLVHNSDSYASRIRQYVAGLHNLADQCAESARTYGYSDEEI